MHPRNQAFSYIEMLLVMLIMLIMIHMMSYHLFDAKKADIDEVNQELLAVINYYQTLAVSTGQSITLTFLPGQKDILIKSTQLGINTRYRIRNGYIYSGNSSTVTFKGELANKGATITYFVNNQRFQLIIQLVRGRVRIESQ
ncbi:hypothetical protein [Macrococcus bovicus]|uniref:Prepilin-type N-terminal cleavage/methylation domain-containing protein n=1 Tax=Macrococcus bovicus TaxID=69968 RepID=A0A4R6C2E7_9STAP|nr:hypothetical protein [Macrococcus bovicus]TDM15530.1 hypothetical protein ERX55_01095 [Macrococcus bovicus]